MLQATEARPALCIFSKNFPKVTNFRDAPIKCVKALKADSFFFLFQESIVCSYPPYKVPYGMQGCIGETKRNIPPFLTSLSLPKFNL